MNQHRTLTLSFGFSFEDLYRRDALVRLDDVFLSQLQEAVPDLHGRLMAARKDPASLALKQSSELIIEVAPHLEDFIGKLFGIHKALHDLQARHHELAPLYAVKRKFIQKKALTWQTPESWTEVPPGEMRVASFKIQGQNGKLADVSVVPLPGMPGTDDANVNRWRGQVGLPSVSPDELKKSGENVEAAGEPA